jgi:hypothetical protein
MAQRSVALFSMGVPVSPILKSARTARAAKARSETGFFSA